MSSSLVQNHLTTGTTSSTGMFGRRRTTSKKTIGERLNATADAFSSFWSTARGNNGARNRRNHEQRWHLKRPDPIQPPMSTTEMSHSEAESGIEVIPREVQQERRKQEHPHQGETAEAKEATAAAEAAKSPLDPMSNVVKRFARRPDGQRAPERRRPRPRRRRFPYVPPSPLDDGKGGGDGDDDRTDAGRGGMIWYAPPKALFDSFASRGHNDGNSGNDHDDGDIVIVFSSAGEDDGVESNKKAEENRDDPDEKKENDENQNKREENGEGVEVGLNEKNKKEEREESKVKDDAALPANDDDSNDHHDVPPPPPPLPSPEQQLSIFGYVLSSSREK